MQQFQVPQFITVEDRIIGPLTLKQFLYLLGGGGVIIIGWFFLKFFLFILFAVPLASLFIALAFAKINGQSFPTVFSNAINYYLKPRLYLWQPGQDKDKKAKTLLGTAEQAREQTMTRIQMTKPSAVASPLTDIPKLSAGKLSDLAWSLDIKEKLNR